MKFKDISIGYVAASLLMILVLFFILGIYGYEFASYLRFPEYAIIKNKLENTIPNAFFILYLLFSP